MYGHRIFSGILWVYSQFFLNSQGFQDFNKGIRLQACQAFFTFLLLRNSIFYEIGSLKSVITQKLLSFLCVLSGEFPCVGPNITAERIELIPVNGSDSGSSSFNLGMFITEFLTLIISLVGVAGNAVVLWLLGFQMQRNAFSISFLNLAEADFIFLLVQSMHYLRNLVRFHYIKIDTPQFLVIMTIFTYVANLSILSAINTERCLSVLWPIWYLCHRPNQLSSVMCALLWTLSLLLSILEAEFCGFLFSDCDNHVFLIIGVFITAWLDLIVCFSLGPAWPFWSDCYFAPKRSKGPDCM